MAGCIAGCGYDGGYLATPWDNPSHTEKKQVMGMITEVTLWANIAPEFTSERLIFYTIFGPQQKKYILEVRLPKPTVQHIQHRIV